MMTDVEKEVLTDTWKLILEPIFENIEIKVSKDTNSKSYSFLVEFKSKLGKRKINWIFVKIDHENQLSISYSKLDAKETRRLLSGLTDVILEQIEHLDRSFLLTKTFGTVKLPALYLNKEEREAKKTRPPSVKKADIIAKKGKILAYFEELKTKALPVYKPDHINDERKVFLIGGAGSKHLADVFVELGIATGFSKWDKSYNVDFNHEHYESSYYSVLYEWEEFVKKEIGLYKSYVYTYYVN